MLRHEAHPDLIGVLRGNFPLGKSTTWSWSGLHGPDSLEGLPRRVENGEEVPGEIPLSIVMFVGRHRTHTYFGTHPRLAAPQNINISSGPFTMRWTGELAMLRLAGSAPGFIGAGFDMESSERGSLRERTAMAVEDTQLCCLTRESFLHLKEAFPTTLKRVEKAAT